MAQYTSDQVMVQRLQTTRSLKDARSAFIVNAALSARDEPRPPFPLPPLPPLPPLSRPPDPGDRSSNIVP